MSLAYRSFKAGEPGTRTLLDAIQEWMLKTAPAFQFCDTNYREKEDYRLLAVP